MALIPRSSKHPKRMPSPVPPPSLNGHYTKTKTRSTQVSLFMRKIRLSRHSELALPLYLLLAIPCLIIFALCAFAIGRSSKPTRRVAPGGTPLHVRKISEKYDKVFVSGCQMPDTNAPRANATFVVLARNTDLEGVIESIKSVERHFNRWYHYPYVFLNDEQFNTTFKEAILRYTSSAVDFGQVPSAMWGYPEWLDKDWAVAGIKRQGDDAIMYGGLESYHHMCRFYSGYFFDHPLLQKYQWYWRIEPEIKYFCDLTYDPFLQMIKQNKTYGFTIAVKELKETVPNIFRYASSYMRTRNKTSRGMWEMFTIRPEEDENFAPENDPRRKKNKSAAYRRNPAALPEIDDESIEGDVYNRCHFWSNFEIANLDWFRSREYREFFELMDRSGGFWRERWGDAPIHSLAVGALLSPADVHYFRDIGYRHTTIQHCPVNAPGNKIAREPYVELTTENEQQRLLEDDYWARPDPAQQNGVGCRCRCDTDIPDVEAKEGSCMIEWVETAGGWLD